MITLLLAAQLAAAQPILAEYRAPVMGTELVVRIRLASEAQRGAADEAFAAVEKEFVRLEALLSEWRPDAPFGRLNDAPTTGIVLPDEAFRLLGHALVWAQRTEGAFDPTFASLWGLWRFDPQDAARLPTREAAKARAGLIDFRKVIVDRATRTVRLAEPQMKLGLGGIAKGYAVDRATALLRAKGFADFFIQAGGELFLSGTRGDRPWLVGVRDPRSEGSYFATLAVENSAFTTSGDYERFLIVDGVRYHHIIDPDTGYPATQCRGVSIIAPTAEAADALSTGVFVMGPERGLALVESLPGVEAVIVTAAGKVLLSSGLAGKIQLSPLVRSSGP